MYATKARCALSFRVQSRASNASSLRCGACNLLELILKNKGNNP